MGEYVININWGGGGSGSKGNTTPTSLLMNPAAATEAATTIAAGAAATNPATATNPAAFFTSLHFANTKGLNREQYRSFTPMDFFSRNRNTLPVFLRDGKKNWRNDTIEDKDNNIEDIMKYYKRISLYASAQALRLANTIASTHYQYASAIASSTAELQAVNEYENIMTGIGWGGSIAAGTAVGAKVGAIGGTVGVGIGAAIGATMAVANKAIKTTTENRILNYKQAINATTSAYQLGVLGDATYGRSRQSIG